MEEHRKYSSACPYLLQNLTSTEVDSSRQAGNQTSYRVRSPQYQTMNARLETFERFPSNVDIPHQQLAVAGLFYTGEGDLCRCFTCDGGLKDWSTGDDPCKEHATYFPKCNYIIQLKGASYVRDMQHRRGSNVPSTGTGGGSAMQTSTATTATTAATTTTTGATTLSMPSMDRLNISGSLNRRSTDIQLREMGYSESDVEHAKAEIRRKGDSNPSVELIVNTILDMQDRTNTATDRTNATQDRTNIAPDRTNVARDRSNATPEAQNESEDIQEIAAEHERLSRIVQCMLCVKEEPDVLFLPCAHHRLCHNCSDKVSRCPVCETVVKEKVRTYRA
ncbi:baculoviral IAP repeat-containing protein 2-like [Ruditapes philippinarum]|uniref:baculoviral IAP repeat-containing protein 2-like n=1 Tax=Ruditapes philippinarum TaxID=129788 RepID=UPI00295C19B4|nr:baculoviral IAP repeat-containing protein 2-like [Ruditapes philippinarum]